MCFKSWVNKSSDSRKLRLRRLIPVHLCVPLTCIGKVNPSTSLRFHKAGNDPRIGSLWGAKNTVRTPKLSSVQKSQFTTSLSQRKYLSSSRKWRWWNQLRSSLLKMNITHIYFTDCSRLEGFAGKRMDTFICLKVFVESRQDKSLSHPSLLVSDMVLISIKYHIDYDQIQKLQCVTQVQKNLPINLNIIHPVRKTSPKWGHFNVPLREIVPNLCVIHGRTWSDTGDWKPCLS